MDRKYVFPILKNAELVVCMKELGAKFSEEDLLRPSPQRISAAFELIFDVLLGTTREDTLERFQKKVTEVENGEIYKDSVPLLSFHYSFSELMQQVGISDYSLKDLQKPEPQKVRKILSACINLLKFREERMPVYDELTEKSDMLLEKYQLLDAQLDQLDQQLSKVKHQEEVNAPQANQIKQRNAELTSELINLKKIQSDLMDQIENLKKERAQLAQQFSEKDKNSSLIKTEIERVSSRIVNSPQKLTDSLKSMEQTLYREKNDLEDLERQVKEIQLKSETIFDIDRNLRVCLQILEDCSTDLGRLEESQRKRNEIEDIMKQKLSDQNELRIKESQLKRQVENVAEKIERAENQRQLKRESAQKRMEQVHLEYNNISKERAKTSQEIDQIKAYIAKTEQKIMELRRSIEIEAASTGTEFNKLKSHVEDYIEKLDKVITLPS